jgi:hypothetical protein
VFGDNCVSRCGFPVDVKCNAVVSFCNGDVKEVDGVICFFFHCELHSRHDVVELCQYIFYHNNVTNLMYFHFHNHFIVS